MNTIESNHRVSNFFYTIAGSSLMLMAALARLSVTLKGITLIIALLAIIASGDWRNNFKMIFNNKIAVAALLLYLGFIVGCTYSIAPPAEQMHMLKLYSSLIFLGFLLPLFKQQKWQLYIINAFIIGCVFIMLLGIANSLQLVNFIKLFHLSVIGKKPEYPFGTFSFPLSFAAYLTAKMAWESKKYRSLYLMGLATFTFFILFLNNERTAYILFIILAFVFFLQHFNVKQGVIGTLVLLLTLGSAFLASDTFHRRTIDVVDSIKSYHQGDPVSSTGLRMLFIKNSLQLWRHRPIFGYGTGSFVNSYLTLQSYNVEGEVATLKEPLDQPHCEYAYIAVQLGLVGLVLFFNLLIVQFISSFKLSNFYKHCAQAFVVCFAVACLDGTLLFYGVDSGYYLLFSALLFARNNQQGSPQIQ